MRAKRTSDRITVTHLTPEERDEIRRLIYLYVANNDGATSVSTIYPNCVRRHLKGVVAGGRLVVKFVKEMVNAEYLKAAGTKPFKVAVGPETPSELLAGPPAEPDPFPEVTTEDQKVGEVKGYIKADKAFVRLYKHFYVLLDELAMARKYDNAELQKQLTARLRRFVLTGYGAPLPHDMQKRLKGVLEHDGWTIIEEHERKHGWTMPRQPDVQGFWQAIHQAAQEKMLKDGSTVKTTWARRGRRRYA